MRLEEACQLLPGDVQQDKAGVTWVKVSDGKTAAAKRRVPIVDPQVSATLLSQGR